MRKRRSHAIKHALEGPHRVGVLHTSKVVEIEESRKEEVSYSLFVWVWEMRKRRSHAIKNDASYLAPKDQ